MPMTRYWNSKTQDAKSAAFARVDKGRGFFLPHRHQQYLRLSRAAMRWLRWQDKVWTRMTRVR